MDKPSRDYLDDLLTLGEAARLLKVKPHVLRRWAKEGKLRVYSPTQRVLLFKRSELVKLLERSER